MEAIVRTSSFLPLGNVRTVVFIVRPVAICEAKPILLGWTLIRLRVWPSLSSHRHPAYALPLPRTKFRKSKHAVRMAKTGGSGCFEKSLTPLRLMQYISMCTDYLHTSSLVQYQSSGCDAPPPLRDSARPVPHKIISDYDSCDISKFSLLRLQRFPTDTVLVGVQSW